MFTKILNPDIYHGSRKKKNYFEGWYYKIVDKDNNNPIAFIPGIIMGSIKEEGNSFIQVLDGVSNKSYYLTYPKDCFKASSNQFFVQINTSQFSLNEIKINHHDENTQFIGNLRFVDIVKWPSTKLNPGSMGFYNYLKFMECYSQVCCIDGGVIGKILINEREIDYSGGKVYIEKNWGSKFPEAYIWIQGNGFKDLDTAFTASIGKIPFLFTTFSGFLVAFKFGKSIYKFSTINKSKMNIDYNANNVVITFTKGPLELKVETMVKENEYMDIKGPSIGKLDVLVKESITSDIRVELIDTNRKTVLFQGVSKNSGIEFMGNLRDLNKKNKTEKN